MDLKRLRTFVAVAEVGTVSRAAMRLSISQPALSRQIRELEQAFGVRLFDRIGRRLMLTTLGAQVLDDCRDVIERASALTEQVARLGRGDRGLLRVAAPPQTIESVMSQFLPRYAARFPNVQVCLTEALGHEQLTLLQQGDVHLGIRHDQGGTSRIASLALPPDDMLAAWAPVIGIDASDRLELRQLASQPLLLPDAGYSVRKMFDAACRLADIEPTVRLESRAPHTLLALAESGYGVAIIPSILSTHRYALRIAQVAQGRKVLRERLVVQWDRRRPLPSYAAQFCRLLADYLRDVLPITRASSPLGARDDPTVRRNRKRPG